MANAYAFVQHLYPRLRIINTEKLGGGNVRITMSNGSLLLFHQDASGNVVCHGYSCSRWN